MKNLIRLFCVLTLTVLIPATSQAQVPTVLRTTKAVGNAATRQTRRLVKPVVPPVVPPVPPIGTTVSGRKPYVPPSYTVVPMLGQGGMFAPENLHKNITEQVKKTGSSTHFNITKNPNNSPVTTPNLTNLRVQQRWPEGLSVSGDGNIYLQGTKQPAASVVAGALPKPAQLIDALLGRHVLLNLDDATLGILCGGKETQLYHWITAKRGELNPGNSTYAADLNQAALELEQQPEFGAFLGRFSNNSQYVQHFTENIGPIGDINGIQARDVFNLPLYQAFGESSRNPSIIEKILQARVDLAKYPLVHSPSQGQYIKLVDYNGQILWEIEMDSSALLQGGADLKPLFQEVRSEVLQDIIIQDFTSKNIQGTVGHIAFIYNKPPEDLLRSVKSATKQQIAEDPVLKQKQQEIAAWKKQIRANVEAFVDYTVEITQRTGQAIPISKKQGNDGLYIEVPVAKLKGFLDLYYAYIQKNPEMLFSKYKLVNEDGKILSPIQTTAETVMKSMDPADFNRLEEVKYIAVLNGPTVNSNLDKLQITIDRQWPIYLKYIQSQLPADKEFIITPAVRFGHHEVSRAPHVHLEIRAQEVGGEGLDVIFNFRLNLRIPSKQLAELQALAPTDNVSNLLNRRPSLPGIPFKSSFGNVSGF